MRRRGCQPLPLAISTGMVPLLVLALASAVTGGSPPPSPGTGPAASPIASPRLPVAELAYPLEGTRWRLTRYRVTSVPTSRATPERSPAAAGPSPADPEQLVGPAIVARLTLARGEARAGVGCGTLSAGYSLDPGPSPSPDRAPVPTSPWAPLSFQGIRLPERPCPLPQAAVGEALAGALSAAASYAIEPGAEVWQAVLRIMDAADTELLVFRVDDASAPEAGLWRLAGLGAGDDDAGPPAADGNLREPAAEAVLAFDPDRRRAEAEGRRGGSGRIVGSTGCNSLSATYRLRGSVLVVRDLEVSDLECPAAVAVQERSILSLLAEGRSLLELPPGGLVIVDPSSGDRLRYVDERRLEGPTWLVSALRGHELGEAVMTLRLQPESGALVSRSGSAIAGRGALEGETPCGPYSGRYVTNGVRIAFAVSAPERRDCPGRALERGLFQALERTAFLDLRTPELQLLDASARVLVGLTQPGAP